MPSPPSFKDTFDAISSRAVALRTPKDLAPLIDRLSQARIVMLGEASHGTHEFYEWRRMISEWLIVKHGFNFIAVEGDWPPCQQLNRYIQSGEGESARGAVEHFRRWPTWMWANTEVVRLAEWMREHNLRREAQAPEAAPVGFHGLDVYSLFESIDAVVHQLERINPFLARRFRNRYACFDPYRHDERAYARSLIEYPAGCEDEVVENLQELHRLRLQGPFEPGEDSLEHAILMDLKQNARVVRNAERYYRSMVHADEDSWNIRDRHMLETLDVLLRQYGSGSRGIVWAHNTHVGDYRATDMQRSGLVNVGGLAREQYGEHQVAIVGFGTHCGGVIASHAWDGPIEALSVPRARADSYEDLCHRVTDLRGCTSFFMTFGPEDRTGPLSRVLGNRAIGVVYDPRHERWGNYVPTSLANRYDAFVFIDETTALEPLILGFEAQDLPETWPSGQ